MAKVHPVEKGHYAIWCPGCESVHVFDTRWTFNGDLERPTFTPSLRVKWTGEHDGKDVKHECHSVVTEGMIAFQGDCTHAMAGQTISLGDFHW